MDTAIVVCVESTCFSGSGSESKTMRAAERLVELVEAVVASNAFAAICHWRRAGAVIWEESDKEAYVPPVNGLFQSILVGQAKVEGQVYEIGRCVPDDPLLYGPVGAGWRGRGDILALHGDDTRCAVERVRVLPVLICLRCGSKNGDEKSSSGPHVCVRWAVVRTGRRTTAAINALQHHSIVFMVTGRRPRPRAR